MVSSAKKQTSHDENNNVIELFTGRKINKIKPKTGELADSCENFEHAMISNTKNQDRLRQERLKANQKVLKAYRIKKK